MGWGHHELDELAGEQTAKGVLVCASCEGGQGRRNTEEEDAVIIR